MNNLIIIKKKRKKTEQGVAAPKIQVKPSHQARRLRKQIQVKERLRKLFCSIITHGAPNAFAFRTMAPIQGGNKEDQVVAPQGLRLVIGIPSAEENPFRVQLVSTKLVEPLEYSTHY